MSFHDELIAKVIPFAEFDPTVGTFAAGVASNVWTLDKSAADDTSVIRIPIDLPLQGDKAYKGCMLLSVVLYFSVATAALDALSCVAFKTSTPADGSAPTAVSVPVTYDAGHDTGAERIDVDDHTMEMTVTTPAWADDAEQFYLELTVDAAATSVFKLGDAVAKFKARM